MEGRGETQETESRMQGYGEGAGSASFAEEQIRVEDYSWEELGLESPMQVKRNYYYCFVPEEDGTYTLFSSGSTEELDLSGALYNGDGKLVQENDNRQDKRNEEEDLNFSLMCDLEEGEPYYLVIGVSGVQSENQQAKENAGFEVTVTRNLQDQISITETETQPASETERETEIKLAIAGGDGAETETAAEPGEKAETEPTEETATESTEETATEPTEETATEFTEETETEPTEKTATESTEETATGFAEEAVTERTEEPGMETEMDTKTGTIPGEEAETQGETEIILVDPQPSGPRSELPMLGGAFVLGIVAALIITRLTGGKKRREAKENPQSDLKKQTDTPAIKKIEEEPVVPAPGGQIGKTHGIGKRRDQQDSFFVEALKQVKGAQPGDMLAVVADGMGGLENGALVSGTVVKVCADVFYQNIETMAPADVLLLMARSVNEEVNRILIGKERSGSTMVIGAVWQGKLYFLTVGDSRIWLWRSGGLIQLNREHIYQEEIALKAVNHQDGLQSVNLDHQKKALTSYVGQGVIKHMDRNVEGIVLRDGDKILLTSDGVFGTIDNAGLEQILYQSAESAGEAIRNAIETKNKAHQDNYTAVIWEYRR